MTFKCIAFDNLLVEPEVADLVVAAVYMQEKLKGFCNEPRISFY